MFYFKRVLVFACALLFSVGMCTGCGSSDAYKENSSNDKISVVCTIFPEYDWAKEVIGNLGDQYELTLLLDDGVDLHSYQPTAADMVKIAECDVFIYVGGESDGWVKDALKEATNDNMKVIDLLDILGDSVKEEEVVEGMQEEDEHDHHDEEGPENDEHVWLSLKNAKIVVSNIASALETVDPAHRDVYQQNSDAYITQLSALDDEYSAVVAERKHDTLVFADRFPFRYLVDDYGLSYHAAFVGCSAETEASFETVIFLAGKTDDLSLSHILVIENSDKRIAQTVIDNTTEKNQDILVLNSMQSTTGKEIEAGASYLSIARSNLEVLKKALN